MSLFDLDGFSAGMAEYEKQTAQINDMLDDMDRIQSLKDSRRAIAEAQIQAGEIKSKLCDKLREEKMKVPGLAERINALEYNDLSLFQYIRKLEFVQDSIWCPKCNVRKNIGGKEKPDTPEQNDKPTEQHDTNIAVKNAQAKYALLEKNFSLVLDHFDNLRNEFQSKISETSKILEQLGIDLRNSKLSYETSSDSVSSDSVRSDSVRSDSVRSDLNTVTSIDKTNTQQTSQSPTLYTPPINSTVKKEDLPRVELHLSQIVDTFDSTNTADSLLND